MTSGYGFVKEWGIIVDKATRTTGNLGYPAKKHVDGTSTEPRPCLIGFNGKIIYG
jgi:hypothetical protein